MQKRRISSLSILLAGTLLAAAGCSDDDEKIPSCNSGDCAGSSGDTGVGGSTSGGSGNNSGGTTSTGGLPGTGGMTPTSGGAPEAGSTGVAGSTGESAGTTSAAGSTGEAGAASAASTAGSTSTAGTSGVAGSTSSGGSSPVGGATNTGGVTGVAGSTGTGGTTSIGGETNTAGTVGIAGAAGSAGTTTFVPGVAILKYDFEAGTGTKVTDTSGNGHDGVLSGATWTLNTEGRNGIASSFATADAAVAVPNNLFTNASGLTVSAWVRLSANEPGNRLFDFGSGLSNHIYFTFRNQDNRMELAVQLNDGIPTSLFTTATLPLNVWKHVTVVLGTSGAHLYVDGWEVARSAAMVVAPSVLGATTSNWIGKSQVPEDPAFAGSIDEFYVYDNAIPLADIRKLAWPKTDYSIWHFDETDGTVAADFSDFKRDATMVRATFATGVVGNAAQLYNTNDTDNVAVDDQYVQLPAGVVQDCTAGYTVATWVNVAAMHTHARVFEFSNNTDNAVFGRIKGGWTEHWCIGDFTTSGTNQYASIDYTWPLGTWHHVAAVRDGQVLHAYLDGVESGTKTPYTLPATAAPVSSLGSTLYNYIGRTRDAAAANERRRLHGFVDEFLLSCRPYTSDEIKLLAVRP